MKKVLLFSAFGLMGLSSLVMTEGRAYAMKVYGAPCGQAAGVAGFLQRVNFLPSGGCTTAVGGGCVTPGSRCTYKSPVSGGTSAGICVTVGTGCSCAKSTS